MENGIMQVKEAKKAPSESKVKNPTVEMMLSQAIDKGLTIDGLEKLIALREKLKAEKAKEAFDEAMSAFQGECPIIEKKTKVSFNTKTGSHAEYAYAELDEIVRQVKSLLAKNGLSYIFKLENMPDGVKAICIAKHVEGGSESSEFIANMAGTSLMSSAQVSASKATYAKRQAFCNVFGIVTGDEDVDAAKTAEEAKAESAATPAQREKINELARDKGLTIEEIAQKVRAHYGVSFKDITSVQAEGIIQSIEKSSPKV